MENDMKIAFSDEHAAYFQKHNIFKAIKEESGCEVQYHQKNKVLFIKGTKQNVQTAFGLVEHYTYTRTYRVKLELTLQLTFQNKLIHQKTFELVTQTSNINRKFTHNFLDEINQFLHQYNPQLTLSEHHFKIISVFDSTTADKLTFLKLQAVVELSTYISSLNTLQLSNIYVDQHRSGIHLTSCHSSLPPNIFQSHLPQLPNLDLVSFVICTRMNEENHKDEILMVLERNNTWFLPAGHVDRGESFSQAGIRETQEEAGVNVSVHSLIDLIYYISPEYSALHCVLFASYISGIVKSVPDRESLAAQWISLQEVVNDIGTGSQSPNALRNYRKAFEIGPMISKFASEWKRGVSFAPILPSL